MTNTTLAVIEVETHVERKEGLIVVELCLKSELEAESTIIAIRQLATRVKLDQVELSEPTMTVIVKVIQKAAWTILTVIKLVMITHNMVVLHMEVKIVITKMKQIVKMMLAMVVIQ